ncbi:MAG: patatin-like phospholipase family protein [Hyphomicrobiales bacterium]
MDRHQVGAPDRKPALVLGGGGAYGLLQAAYVQAAFERGFEPAMVVGTSVGTLNGAWVAVHPHRADELLPIWLGLDRIRLLQLNPLRVASRLIRRPVSICTNRIVPQLIERYLPGARFEDTKLPLAVVATNLSRARKHVFRSGPLEPAILASTAIPGVFEPVEIEGELFVDGGLVGSCDLATAVEMGATEILAIDLTPPAKPRRPRTALGVLRHSLDALGRASTDAMESCLEGQLPMRVITPDLSRSSPWRMDVTVDAINHNLELARRAMASVLDSHGQVIPGSRTFDAPAPAPVPGAPAPRRLSLPWARQEA